MNNRFLGAGIAFALILIVIFIVVGSRDGAKSSAGTADAKYVPRLVSEGKIDEAKKLIDEIRDKNPDSDLLGKLYYDIGSSYEEKQDFVKARDIYRIILTKYQNVNNILEVQERLSKLNIKILFSPIVTDEDVFYRVEQGDTLSEIARKFGTTIDLIKVSNSLKNDTIRAGSKLKVSKHRYKILADKSQNLLTLLSQDGSIVKSYRISTGENNSTPAGTFRIVNRIKDPVWYTDGIVIPSESPDNILGSRWLGLSEAGYGIHGTVSPESVGQQATKGCIRMLNPEVEELYAIVPVGTEVTIVE